MRPGDRKPAADKRTIIAENDAKARAIHVHIMKEAVQLAALAAFSAGAAAAEEAPRDVLIHSGESAAR